MAHVDPELTRQLTEADDEGMVEAVVRLKPTSGAASAEPDETERLTHQLMARVQRSAGQQENEVNVFRNLGSFAVSARPAFLKKLIAQPEVAAAVANRQPGSGSIPPVAKRPSTLEDVGRESKRRPPARKARKSAR